MFYDLETKKVFLTPSRICPYRFRRTYVLLDIISQLEFDEADKPYESMAMTYSLFVEMMKQND